MASPLHDGNNTPTLIAVQDNGTTILNIQANPSTHALAVEDNTTGSDNGPSNSRHAEGVPVLMAVSSADGKTPVVVYGNSSGQLLIDSN